ncbi:MAG: TRAP transporter small permease [Rhizobiaceae bacterium]|nr:TRAP transporter small permease [Rhizobiaceae bacterium]
MSTFRTLDHIYIRSIALVCIALFVVMLAAILSQVVMRYVFSNPLSWSEELARYSMVWLAMMAAALCSRASQHLTLISAEMLPPPLQKPLRYLGTLIACVILGVLFWHATDLAVRTARQTTPGLGLSMSWIYAALPTGFALMILGQVLGLFFSDARAMPEETDTTNTPV